MSDTISVEDFIKAKEALEKNQIPKDAILWLDRDGLYYEYEEKMSRL